MSKCSCKLEFFMIVDHDGKNHLQSMNIIYIMI